MPGDTYFAPTDQDGTQHVGDDVIKWPLPQQSPTGTLEPGDLIEPPTGVAIVLHDLDGLLEDLGERIFTAEVLEGGPGRPERARLVAETRWNLHAAARLALDCAEHAISDPAAFKLPSGATIADIFSAARRYLDRDETAGEGLLQRVSRLAQARRLRHLGDDVADLAFKITLEDEAADLDALDDPTWTAVAAIRDAVLAAVEAIRHDAFPRLFESENSRYEADIDSVEPAPEMVSTPWGNFTAGARSGVVPAWVAARDAAERARTAIADANGPESGAAEREWQRGRLATALGLR